jgi:integrase
MTPRTRRRRFDDKAVERLRPKPKRYSKPDSELIGHYVRVMPSGVKSYVAVARDPFGKKQIWTTIASTDHISIEEARTKAREIIARVKRGLLACEPPPPAPDSFAVVAENWIKRHVEKQKLRTQPEICRILNRYVLPVWRDRPFTEIKRSDVTGLLDQIEDNHGATQADKALTVIRSICTWFARRSDSYTPPFVAGMKRCTNGSRERILDDDEIRTLWKVAERSGQFGALLQLALLTAQRKAKLFRMRWSDISADGVWTIPTEAREKGNAGELVLPDMARAILHRQRQSRIHGSDLVFPPATGAGKMSSSHGMLKIRAALPKGFPQFTIHDLRRTARSLMSRAGVNPEHAERVLGHVIGGAEGIYDRHSYRDEKRIVLEKLAALIEQIIGETPDKVVPIKAARS